MQPDSEASVAASAAAIVANVHLPSSGADHYAVLGVSRTSTEDQIRAAFKKLVRENHPDKSESLAQGMVLDMENRDHVVRQVARLLQPIYVKEMQVLNEAVTLLTNPKKRAQYDAVQASASSGHDASAFSGHDASAFSGHDASASSGHNSFDEMMREFFAQGLGDTSGSFMRSDDGSFIQHARSPRRGRGSGSGRRRGSGTAVHHHVGSIAEFDAFLAKVTMTGGSVTFTVPRD